MDRYDLGDQVQTEYIINIVEEKLIKTGLTEGGRYVFRVSAYNEAGKSESSFGFEIYAGEKPSKPFDLSRIEESTSKT